MKTVSFYGMCPARSTVVLVSKAITHAYDVKRIRASFRVSADNLLQLEFFVSPDSDAPSSGKPNGLSMLADYGQVAYVVGNDEVCDMQHEVESDSGGSWIKVYANNSDYYEHAVNVQVFIEPIERRDG